MEETIENNDAVPTEEKEETGFQFVDGVLETDDSDTEYGEDYVEPTPEVVEESPAKTEEAPIEEIKDIPHKEDPSRFEFWQSKFTQEQNARKELEDKVQSFEQKMEVFAKPPKEEPKPLEIPREPMPDADGNIDPLDEVKYLRAENKYIRHTVDKISGTFEQQEKARKEAEQSAYLKAKTLGEYQNVGVEASKSQMMYDFYTSEESIDPKIGEIMFDAVQAYKGMQSQDNPKTEQMKAKQEKYEVPPPPGVVSGKSDVPKQALDFAEDLLGYQKSTY